jgi:hypothetical protein
MNARPGRPPKQPEGHSTTLTLRIPSSVKRYLIETSENLDMSITEYLLTLIKRDAADEVK